MDYPRIVFVRCRKYKLKMNPSCSFGVPFEKFLGFTIHKKGIDLDPVNPNAIQDTEPPNT